MTTHLDKRLTTLLLKIVLPVLLLALGIGGSWWLIAYKTEADEAKVKKVKHEPPTVTVTAAKQEALRMDVASQGVVLPKIEIDLVPEVSGKVVKAHPNFAPGGYIKKGETLLVIDSRDSEFAVTRAHAAVADAYKELLREREEALQAAEEWQALGSGKATDYVLHKPQLKEREAKYTAAQADLAAAKLQLERCRLVAPFSGWLRDKRVLPGQYLNSGEKIAQFYADASAEVRLPIPADQLEHLAFLTQDGDGQNGPEVLLTAHLGNKEPQWRGRIVRTTSSLDDKNAMLYAIAEIPNAFRSKAGQAALMPGQFVKATIAGIERFDLVSLPKSALFGGNQIYSIDKQDKLKLITVEILRHESDRIIISKGIAPDERILITGVELPIDGMKVNIKSANSAKEPVSSAELVK